MMRERRLRVGALVSGGGRSVLNLHACIERGKLPAELVVAVSSRASAPAVERLRAVGLRVEVVERGTAPDTGFHREIAERLRAAQVELVCMAGFLSHWEIPVDFSGRVINIHPALLPKFGGRGYYGERVQRAVLDAGETESGCTVHFADNEYDHGPVILQRRVAVLPGDTVDLLAARVFDEEKIALPEVVRMFADGRLELPVRQVARQRGRA